MNLNKHLAEMMGLEFREGGRKDEYWQDIDGDKFGLFWNPSENIEQAMMCLSLYNHPAYRIDFSIEKIHRVSFWPDVTYSKNKFEGEHKSLPLAISLVCARASGWEE